MKKKVSARLAQKRLDDWVNVLTGLGMANRDKLTGAVAQFKFLNQDTLDALYQSDDVAARIVDREPDDMCREGFEIKILDDKPELAELAMAEFNKVCGLDKMNQALKWANLYGTGLLYIGMEGADPVAPIEKSLGKPIKYIAVVDRYMVTTSGNITEDLSSKNFGYPETYQLVTGKLESAKKAGESFHYSRACRFDGKELSSTLLKKNNYFGDSVLSSIYNCIRNYNQVNESAALIVQDFSQAVFKLKNLSDMIASGDTAKVIKRFELVSRTSSIANMLVIEDGEEYEKKTPALGGIDILISAVGNRLVSATSMPHTILLGESPSGLGATGNSEKIDWYDHIKNQQQKKMLPALTKIFDLIFSTRGGITRGKIPQYQIKFNPLWQMDEKEKSEIRNQMSQADERYFNMGVLTAEEIAQSRFAGDYSVDTDLDEENRKALEEPDTTQGGEDEETD